MYFLAERRPIKRDNILITVAIVSTHTHVDKEYGQFLCVIPTSHHR